MSSKIVKSTEQDREYIHQQLQRYNEPFMSDWEDLSFHAEENGKIVAGIVAERTGDAVEVAFLFVDEAYRRRGLGSALLAQVEAAARKKNVRRIMLNTYSFQAPELYRKLGYQELFQLAPCFGAHSQFYFAKEL